ncbi:glycosyltransferase family 4 protein [Salinibaculum salinum]|uniref:glycosyltransferase family 4 protein n=1 Tax=Salinibaculum salinum TaxID=3131996 RepID=UPI0030EB3703
MSDPGPLAVFTGAATSVNVSHMLDDIASMVPGVHHLVATDTPVSNDTEYREFGTNNPSSVQGQFRALTKYLDAHTPRILLQITDPPLHGTIAGLVAQRYDVPFVYRYSGDRFYEYRVAKGREQLTAFALGAILGRVPIRLATRHIALGPTGKRRLIARGVPPERITVLPPTIDPARFDDPSPVPLDIPDNYKLILFVGRLSRLKGTETLERIIPAVLDRRNDLQFVCVGSVERELNVPASVRDHVMTIGKVSPDTVSDYMAAADLLVHPTLTEGVPRVLLESLAAETPVLARDVGDIASVTENTFDSDKEFENRLVDLESIPLDDISPFTPEQLESTYRDFFEDW